MKLLKLNLALTLLLLVSTHGNAATITVTANHGLVDNTDGVCSISEAIINANDDAQTHVDCPSGSGIDSIELTQDITLSVQYENDATYGSTGTPAISTTLILDGKGFALQRSTIVACNLDRTITAGEFRILRTSAAADLSLQNITIANGCADGGRTQTHGGGLYNQGAFLSLQQVTFKQNECSLRGGAILHKGGTISLITNSLFVSNSGLEGGVIGMVTPSIIGTIENSTFSNNTGGIGSVIFMYDTTINTIQNTTFAGNSLSSALYNDRGTIDNLQNTLFDNYTGTNEPDCINLGGGTMNGSNNISSDPSPAIRGCPGLLATLLDPLTVDVLADNGGATQTHALLAGSQAIDAGDSNSTTTDQRGFGLNGVRDIGAFEAQVIELCPMALQTDGFSTTVNDAAELIQAIECSNVNGNTNADIISLNADINLLQEYENHTTYGSTGTPPITTTMTLDGKGFALQRDSSLSCIIDATNTADEFRILRTTTTADLSLLDITIAQGCANGGRGNDSNGGGLHNRGNFLSLQQVTFKQNKSRGDGGAINHVRGTITLIRNSLFVGNTSFLGGAIAMNESTDINTIENSTFSNNAGEIGSAISNVSATINTIQNTTFSNNSLSMAIYNSAGIINNLQNTLFHNNTGSSDPDCRNFQFGIINGSNNITTQPNPNLTVGCPGFIAAVLDPLTVGDLSDNGGATMTHALLPGSQALDAGDSNSTTTDQRGFGLNGVRDIGAYEAQIPVITAPADVVVESTGATTAVSLGTAVVVDDEMGLIATVDNLGPFAMGMTTVTWSVTDSHGFSAVNVAQVVNVQAIIAGTITGLTGTVSLQNNNMDTININANGGFRFSTALNNLSNYTVTVSQQPATQNCVINNASGQVNGANISDITVTCSNNTLSLSSSTLDFGVVFAGENSTQTMTLTNIGTGDVTIGSFTNPPAPFTLIGGSCLATPITLTVGQSCDFIVQFTSSGEGDFSGSFDVLSNAASSPATINLLGHAAIRIIPTLSFYGLLLMMVSFLSIVYYRNKT